MTRAGYGRRHPDLVALLATLTPAASQQLTWPGDVPVRVGAYPAAVPAGLPDELITSVRCIVRVGDRVVVCRAPDEQHIWPGGRREPGETYAETARREVHEETGWQIAPDTLVPLGFLHYRLVRPQPAGHPLPHPDFLQLVYTAPATGHAGPDPAGWADLDGWELGHRLLTRAELATVELTAIQRAFLDVLPYRD